MEVKIILDEDDEVLVNYYAEVMGKSVEDVFKDALMNEIRELYESQAESAPQQKCTYTPDPVDSDDMFSDEDR